ncbi:MAG: MMPL family transporter [Actinobacteria bacterium]|nr:MMPL family transporter [Actinomycetota bacterium]
MFEKLGHLIVKRRKRTLGFFFLAILILGSVGSMVFSRLDSGGYSDPKSESAQVWTYLTDTFKVKDPAVVLVVKSKTNVDDPDVISTALELETKVRAESSAEKVMSYWTAGKLPMLRSNDGKSAYIFVYLKSTDFSSVDAIGGHYRETYEGAYKNVEVLASGGAIFANSINGKIKDDLKLAESISIPLTFVLLIFVFGAMAASAMPLVIGITSILGAFFILYLITLFTDVSIFALNQTTGLGLGLGIDYALLIVNRFREELHHGKDVETSVVNTLATAGKTVFYSGLTVMITLISLMFFPQYFLKSMGYAGVAVVALAVAGALIPLPAILALMGKRIDFGVLRKSAITPKEDGRWADIARTVMRRPVAVVVLSLLILSIFIAPIKDIVFSQVDSRVLPANNSSAIAAKFISDNFSGQEGNPIEIIIPNGASQVNSINEFKDSLAVVPGIVRVGQMEVAGEDVRLTAIHSMPPRTPEGQDLIHKIRALTKPAGTLIGGVAADYADTQDATSRTLRWVALWIGLGILILLFIFTGSIILPIKAVLNIISLAATMGVLTWIFIDGHMRWLVGDFTVTGSVDTGSIVLIAVIAFGLSMDYELFLLSRIKEEHEAGKSNIESVATGLQRSARIITAAAVLLAVVFGTFCISGITSIKMLGFGVAFAILLDATLIRAFLVPALMRLFGERNWWAPKSLKRFTISH